MENTLRKSQDLAFGNVGQPLHTWGGFGGYGPYGRFGFGGYGGLYGGAYGHPGFGPGFGWGGVHPGFVQANVTHANAVANQDLRYIGLNGWHGWRGLNREGQVNTVLRRSHEIADVRWGG